VDGDITDSAIRKLSVGVDINIDGKTWHTKKAAVEKLKGPSEIDERNPPVRFRKNIPTSWIRLTLTEGKNRQVRRMTASVGFPTLRLIRYAIGELKLDGIIPGSIKILDDTEKELLFRKKSFTGNKTN
jgi:23S rRNA pseudouridine2457 synthase